jgi:mannose-6-phosphate isomerase
MFALGDFWLLHGFKLKEKLSRTLSNTPELQFLLEIFDSKGYESLYQRVMEMPQPDVNSILQPLLDRILPAYKKNALSKDEEDFWAARAAMTYNSPDKIDRGIFSIYFFNLVHCKRGEAVFQDAGVPHAYLEGQNVEIMSNSDNVLRGGLTPKHIDVPELMKHIKFEGITPNILKGKKRNEIEEVYETPAPDFELSRFQLENGRRGIFTSAAADILFIETGILKLSTEQHSLELGSGEAAIVFNNTDVQLSSEGSASVFRASVPVGISE